MNKIFFVQISVLMLENRPKVWRKKQSYFKTAKVRQTIFHMIICLKLLFFNGTASEAHTPLLKQA